MYKKIVLICGMPRSGTSWLGQIFDSSPDVAFRMEPLFAYRFKNAINASSTKEELDEFFASVYLTDDEFIHQKESRKKGVYDTFEKKSATDVLVIKTTRHHHLLEQYLKLSDCIDIVSIIRHPCAVISSWINTEREFLSKGCTVENDWRSGECRKDGEGEFWGFDDWLSVTRQHVGLAQQYKNFHIIKYADLIHDSDAVIRGLFKELSIPCTSQTLEFLKDCNRKHSNDPYSIFKNKDVENKWKDSLNNNAIAQEILLETMAFGLDEFI